MAGIVQKHGWEFKGSPSWRSQTVYSTNLRTAHMAGRWKQVQRVKARRPYLIYSTVGDQQVRDEHRSWHKLVLPIDSPWWDTHYPPNGWGCRCFIRSTSERDLKREGLDLSEAPTIKTTERINTGTGEVYGEVPVGMDTGWDYNVGKAWLGPDISFGQKLMQLPPVIRSEALQNNGGHIAEMGKSWKTWLSSRTGQRPSGYAHTVGYIPNQLINRLVDDGVDLKGAAIIVFDRQIDHLIGKQKFVAALAKTENELRSAPYPFDLAERRRSHRVKRTGRPFKRSGYRDVLYPLGHGTGGARKNRQDSRFWCRRRLVGPSTMEGASQSA